jgi:hypothetical protein
VRLLLIRLSVFHDRCVHVDKAADGQRIGAACGSAALRRWTRATLVSAPLIRHHSPQVICPGARGGRTDNTRREGHTTRPRGAKIHVDGALSCSAVLGGSVDVDGRDEEEGSKRARDQDFASHRTPRTQPSVTAVHS